MRSTRLARKARVSGSVLLDGDFCAHLRRRCAEREGATLECAGVMGEEVEGSGFPVMEIKARQSLATC